MLGALTIHMLFFYHHVALSCNLINTAQIYFVFSVEVVK
jgi:hypothetical protein